MAKDYPEHRRHLGKLITRLRGEIPGPMKGFSELHAASLEDGALSTGTKELIALGIAITSHCDGCVAFHVSGALRAGASREQITETIGVAVLMGGGPALMYGAEALEAVDQFAEAAA